jgi:hypothetical protein
MLMRQAVAARTAFLSRLIGVYCILIALAMAAHKRETIDTVIALVHDAPVLYVFGLLVVAVGLAMILTHNVWSGGPLPVIVTLVGWSTLIKGMFFLFLPPPAAVGIVLWGTAYERFFFLDVAVAFCLGAYLTYAGFRVPDPR